MDRCGQCGFVYEERNAPAAPADITTLAATMADLLVSTDRDQLAARPDQTTWSPLEYGCHVRDVLLVQRERLLLGRREERPVLTSMGRDERVEYEGYAEQDPHDVARQLNDAAALFANAASRLDDRAWNRTVVYQWPSDAERTLRWVAVHTVHELQHHTGDICAGLGLGLTPGRPPTTP